MARGARRRQTKAACLAAAVVCLAAGGAAAQGGRDPGPARLQAIGVGDLGRLRMLWTGCSWTQAGLAGIRYVAMNDRALVRSDGSFRWLRPVAGAPDAFPFSYDRWKGSGTQLSVTRRGPVIYRDETVSESVLVRMTIGRGTWWQHGVLTCGS